MQVLRVPSWRFELLRADYWGRAWCLHVGPLLILWGKEA